MSSPPTSSTATAPLETGATKEKLLATAERLFAEHGANRTSLRAITAAAGVNLAAVNYHFGSKENLLRAVLARRLGPLNQRRLELLSEAQSRHAQPPPVAEIVRAFVEPVLLMVQRERGGHAFARFVSRTFSEPDPAIRDLVLSEFDEVFHRFSDALQEALPHLAQDEIYWRFLFMVGAMIQTAGFGFVMHQLTDGVCDPLDVDGVVERLVQFVDGGMNAPGAGVHGGAG